MGWYNEKKTTAQLSTQKRREHCLYSFLLSFSSCGVSTLDNDNVLGYRADISGEKTTLVVVEVLLYVHRSRRFIRDGSPERPPRLSHCSWALYNGSVFCLIFIQRAELSFYAGGTSFTNSSWLLLLCCSTGRQSGDGRCGEFSVVLVQTGNQLGVRTNAPGWSHGLHPGPPSTAGAARGALCGEWHQRSLQPDCSGGSAVLLTLRNVIDILFNRIVQVGLLLCSKARNQRSLPPDCSGFFAVLLVLWNVMDIPVKRIIQLCLLLFWFSETLWTFP